MDTRRDGSRTTDYGLTTRRGGGIWIRSRHDRTGGSIAAGSTATRRLASPTSPGGAPGPSRGRSSPRTVPGASSGRSTGATATAGRETQRCFERRSAGVLPGGRRPVRARLPPGSGCLRFRGNRTNFKNILESGNIPPHNPGLSASRTTPHRTERFPSSFHGAARSSRRTDTSPKSPQQRRSAQALCRTRTEDPFLNMERSARHERAPEGTFGQVPLHSTAFVLPVHARAWSPLPTVSCARVTPAPRPAQHA